MVSTLYEPACGVPVAADRNTHGGGIIRGSPLPPTMKLPKPSAEAAQRLQTLLSGDPRVEVRKMFGHPAAFANGNMCVGTFGDDVFVRLDEPGVRALTKVTGVRPFEPMPGRPMKQYLVLPPSLLKNSAQSKKWVQRSIEYALTLPPK